MNDEVEIWNWWGLSARADTHSSNTNQPGQPRIGCSLGLCGFGGGPLIVDDFAMSNGNPWSSKCVSFLFGETYWNLQKTQNSRLEVRCAQIVGTLKRACIWTEQVQTNRKFFSMATLQVVLSHLRFSFQLCLGGRREPRDARPLRGEVAIVKTLCKLLRFTGEWVKPLLVLHQFFTSKVNFWCYDWYMKPLVGPFLITFWMIGNLVSFWGRWT